MTALFTLAELRTAAGDPDITTDAHALVLERVTAKLTAAAPRAFIASGSHTVRRQVLNGAVSLPRPVTAVTAVAEIDEDGTTGDAVTDYTYDGIDRVSGLRWPATVAVTYTGGYATVPADVKDIGLAVAVRMVANPRGVRTTATTLGAYSESETYAGSDADVAGSDLLPSERAALRRYRAVAGTTVLR